MSDNTELSIVVDDKAVLTALNKVNKDHVKFIDSSGEAASLELKMYMKNKVISGQVLGVVTGETKKALNYKKVGKGKFLLSYGRLNYLSVFETGETMTPKNKSILHFVNSSGMDIFAHSVQMPKNRFHSRGFASFVASNRAEKHVSNVIVNMLKERGLYADK